MKSFSLRRVAHYARYHYSVTRYHYLSFVVAAIALPTLFGVLNHSLQIVPPMLVAIYLFGGVAMAVSTTRPMRGRGTKILDGVLPVSAAERQVFNAFNLCVMFPLLFAVISAVALGAVSLFNEDDYITFGSAFANIWDYALGEWATYVAVQIICSACLLINICARRSLVFAYAMLFFASMAALVLFVCGMEWLSENVYMNWEFDVNWEFEISDRMEQVILYTIKTLYVMIPVSLYLLGYVALRRRQVKW